MITGMLLASIGLAGCGKKSEDDITNKEIYQDDLEPLTEEELNEMDAETTDKAETSDSSAKKSADKTETSDFADTTKSETKTKTEK